MYFLKLNLKLIKLEIQIRTSPRSKLTRVNLLQDRVQEEAEFLYIYLFKVFISI